MAPDGVADLLSNHALHLGIQVGVVLGHAGGGAVERVLVLGEVVLILEASAQFHLGELLAVDTLATEGIAMAEDGGRVGAAGVGECVVVAVSGILAHHVQLHFLAVRHAVGIEQVEFGKIIL